MITAMVIAINAMYHDVMNMIEMQSVSPKSESDQW